MRNRLKNGSLSENVMKEGERVLFQPLHQKSNRRGLPCGHFATSTDLIAPILQFWQKNPRSSLLSQISNSKDWRLYWASKGPLFGA